MTQQLLNTLYVLTQGAYVRLDHETVRVENQGDTMIQVPLHHLDGVTLFGNVLVSPYFLHRCARDGRSLVWFDEYGRFQGRLSGPVSGNVLLRKAQYDAINTPELSMKMARQFVRGKIGNSRLVLQRSLRDSAEANPDLQHAIDHLGVLLNRLDSTAELDEIRGVEGAAAAAYFSTLGGLLRANAGFQFSKRIRRPPRDPFNALLSFCYTLLVSECVAALEGVGLDPQAGYLHALRPGRPSLALDLMEELRPVIADRLAITLVNRGQITLQQFTVRTGGAVQMSDDARSTLLAAYQNRKREEVMHPALRARVPLGLVAHVQARLLARFLRGDMEEYTAFRAR